MIGSWPALRGVRLQFFSCTGTPYCVLIARTRGPGPHAFTIETNPTKAGEERECQRMAEVTDPPLAAAAWES